ncbi:MAG: Peptidase family [Geminicoccaceae bacterium]|nr:Peptidase family [Geminicoccaceae bacterium]
MMPRYLSRPRTPGRAAGCALLSLVALALGACESAPVTGRNQLILVPESQDADLGLQAYQQIRSEERVSRDAELNRRVQEVGRRIAAVSGQPDWDWQFTVFENDEPNAFALPGGKVGVYSGLFKVAKNDDQLATVLAHEVGHAIARHGAERMSQGMLTQLGGVAVGAATGNQAYVQAYSQLATLGVILPYSRKQESEADHIGVPLDPPLRGHPHRTPRGADAGSARGLPRRRRPLVLGQAPGRPGSLAPLTMLSAPFESPIRAPSPCPTRLRSGG